MQEVFVYGEGDKKESFLKEVFGKEYEYLFRYVIGAAMLLEFDNGQVRSLMINEAFYQVVGRGPEFFNQYSDDLGMSVLPQDEEDMARAVEEAFANGESQCRMHRLDTNQTFRVRYRFVGNYDGKQIMFCQLDDITEQEQNERKIQALVSLPGSIIYDYDALNDCMVMDMSTKDGYSSLRSENFLKKLDSAFWLDPQHTQVFRKAFHDALNRANTGYADFKGRFGTKKICWYRAYYRSMADHNERVYRIVGRIDDLERNAWTGMPYERFRIYDSATQLLTHQALSEYIAKELGEKQSGTMLIIWLENLEEVKDSQGEERRVELLRKVTDAICRGTQKQDLFGSVGDGGFMVFKPGFYDGEEVKVQFEKICAIVKAVLKEEEVFNVVPRIGAAITTDSSISVEDLLVHSSTALQRARNQGKMFCLYVHEKQPEIAEGDTDADEK
ncbi:MAG: diguanylate cyclase [Eubacteriales bacterium]|nr:diguanylate cyclase [Eubacteriales bacterium]